LLQSGNLGLGTFVFTLSVEAKSELFGGKLTWFSKRSASFGRACSEALSYQYSE
jgi:hypothetical protein